MVAPSPNQAPPLPFPNNSSDSSLQPQWVLDGPNGTHAEGKRKQGICVVRPTGSAMYYRADPLGLYYVGYRRQTPRSSPAGGCLVSAPLVQVPRLSIVVLDVLCMSTCMARTGYIPSFKVIPLFFFGGTTRLPWGSFLPVLFLYSTLSAHLLELSSASR